MPQNKSFPVSRMFTGVIMARLLPADLWSCFRFIALVFRRSGPPGLSFRILWNLMLQRGFLSRCGHYERMELGSR